jgi:hypothetical protein
MAAPWPRWSRSCGHVRSLDPPRREVPPGQGSSDPIAGGSLGETKARFFNRLKEIEQCTSPTGADFTTG